MAQRLERSFRGISTRLAVRYLENLGGNRLDDGDRTDAGTSPATAEGGETEAVVATADWTAAISSGTVDIGPSLRLTEVTVVFEGDPEALESLVDRFERKALRAGG